MYIIDVQTPSKLITYKNRQVRTPASFLVPEKDIQFFKVMLRQVGAEEYTVQSKSDVDHLQKEYELSNEFIQEKDKNQEVPIEELEEIKNLEKLEDPEDYDGENRSILDQLVMDAKRE